MKRTIALGLMLLTLAGCTQTPTTTTSTTSKETLKETRYAGTVLPARVENLQGTPLFSDSVELSSKVGSGTAFILLSPTDPQKGVLVVVREPAPAEVASKPSSAMNVTGDVKTVAAAGLSPYKGIQLASQDGKLQYVEASGVVWPQGVGAPSTPGDVSGSGTPGTPVTPEGATPATPLTPETATPGTATPLMTPGDVPTQGAP